MKYCLVAQLTFSDVDLEFLHIFDFYKQKNLAENPYKISY